MTGKSNIELLMANPAALKRFCADLAQWATVCDVEDEISKLSDSLRVQLTAARACGFNTDNLLDHCRTRKHDLLLTCAYAIGQERGTRLGKQAAEQIILEAKGFAVMQTAKALPWLEEEKPTEKN